MSATKVTFQEVNEHVKEIIRLLAIDNWKPDIIVGVAKGGLYPALLLSNYFSVPIEIIKCETNEDGNVYSSTGKIDRKKRVLLIDGVNDMGDTLDRVKTVWGDRIRWGTHARIAVLYNNTASGFTEVNYTARTFTSMPHEEMSVILPWEDWWSGR